MKFCIAVVIIVCAWEATRIIYIGWFPLSLRFFPTSFEIATSFVQIFDDLVIASYQTILKIVFAIIGSGCVGVFSGLVLARSKIVSFMLMGVVDFIRSIPPSALFPLFIILFGSQQLSKFVASVYFPALIIAVLVAEAYQKSSKSVEKVWLINGVSDFRIFKFVVLPESIRHSIIAIQGNIGLIVAIVIVSEMYLGFPEGLGAIITTSFETLEYESLYASIIFSGLLGLGAAEGIRRLGNSVLFQLGFRNTSL